jgi:hypothetical protein
LSALIDGPYIGFRFLLWSACVVVAAVAGLALRWIGGVEVVRPRSRDLRQGYAVVAIVLSAAVLLTCGLLVAVAPAAFWPAVLAILGLAGPALAIAIRPRRLGGGILAGWAVGAVALVVLIIISLTSDSGGSGGAYEKNSTGSAPAVSLKSFSWPASCPNCELLTGQPSDINERCAPVSFV